MESDIIRKFMSEHRLTLYIGCAAAFVLPAALLWLISGGVYSVKDRLALVILSLLVSAIVLGLWVGVRMLNRVLNRGREPRLFSLLAPLLTSAILYLGFLFFGIFFSDMMFMLGIAAVLGVFFGQAVMINSYFKQ